MLDATGLRSVVRVLCASEIISWGVLFYAFPVLAGTIARTEGWSLTTLVAIFTAAQVIAAAAGIWVGRRIDRRGPHAVMTAGSVLGVVAVLAIATSPNLPTFALAWALLGAAMSATLYPPAFAAVTHWAGPVRRVRALTTVTLVAGLASTVFAPVTAVLADHGTWRSAYLFLTLPLALTIPLHAIGLRRPWLGTAAPEPSRTSQAARRNVRRPRDPVTRQPAFVLLVAALTLAGFSVYAVVVNFVPLLNENGISTTAAAVALGIGGAGQVAGRLFYSPVLGRMRADRRTAVTLAAAALTTAALAVVPGPIAAVCAVSFAAGSARGIFTLIQATAVSDRWGTTSYGARSSILSGAVTTAAAVSPWVGAALAASLGSYAAAFLVLAALAALAVLLSLRTTH